MLLAGGEGKRLAPLTEAMAKPAVPFGGHHRIIDYTLQNCARSGISRIGLLTQYKAESLHRHVSQLISEAGGVSASISLLPSDASKGGYAGTADAIYQNLSFLDEADYVLILSGDHIYEMDYSDMLTAHISSGADATIAVMRVPWPDASRYGIVQADISGAVTGFVEKPAIPDSNLASMGIYLFNKEHLKTCLQADADNAASSRDFGKDIIPSMLSGGSRLHVFRFGGYWRDVGTINSLWEAHMDLLDGSFGDSSLVCPLRRSILHPQSTSIDSVDRSIIFGGVSIGGGSEVRNSLLMPNVTVGRNVQIFNSIIGEGCVIEDDSVVGELDGEITVFGAFEYISVKPSLLRRTNLLLRDLYTGNQSALSKGSHA